MKVEDYISFCESSMNWCKDESERSAEAIVNVLNRLYDQLKQASAMSGEALSAMNKVLTLTKSSANDHKIQAFISVLSGLKAKHMELTDTLNPLIQSLQFQDRISQNMDNLRKMLVAWSEQRGGSKSLHDFGVMLLEKTTMDEERQIIHRNISGLPQKQEQKDALFF